MSPNDHFASTLVFTLLKAYWPLLLLLGLISVGKLVWQLWQKKRLAASGLADIDAMDGQTFEKYLEALFIRLGYQVERTRYVGDYGADLVAVKGGTRLVVQAKRYKKKVGVKAVQEAVAAKGMYRCTEALVVTNSVFTEQARTLAKANGVLLHDREWLITQLLALKQAAQSQSSPLKSSAPLPASLDSPEPPQSVVCAVCGRDVSENVAAFCRQHARRFEGKIYCFAHQKNSRQKAN